MNTFFFDNSALNEIIQSEETTDWLINLLCERKLRVAISIDAITENFEGNLEHVKRRLPQLRKLIEETPRDQLIITKSAGYWLALEKRRNGKLKNIPNLYSSTRWPGFWEKLKEENFDKFYISLTDDRERQQKHKADLLANDKIFRKKGQEILKQKELLELLEDFRLKGRMFDMKHLKSIFKLSYKQTRKIISSDQTLFRIHKTYLSAIYLRSIGNAFTDYHRYPQFAFLSKLKKGNWDDLGLIAQASPFDFFVSNDKDQIEICNFLKSRHISVANGIYMSHFKSQMQNHSKLPSSPRSIQL